MQQDLSEKAAGQVLAQRNQEVVPVVELRMADSENHQTIEIEAQEVFLAMDPVAMSCQGRQGSCPWAG